MGGMAYAPKSNAEETALSMLEAHGPAGVLDAIESRICTARDGKDHDGLIFWYLVRQAVDNLLLHQRPPDAAVH
jgi:hypothetical protein